MNVLDEPVLPEPARFGEEGPQACGGCQNPGAHLHFWLIARPAGMLQMRGTCLPIWDDVIPKASEEEWRA